jgi:signal transduction histidine kinase
VLGGLAHELKNPRQAMENVLYLLRAQPDLTDQSRLLLQSLTLELERMAVIIDQMLAAGRKSLRRELLQPRTVLEKVLSFYSSKIAFKHIEVVRRFESVDSIYASPTEVEQIFSNIIVNALESAYPGGTLVLHVYPSARWAAGQGIRVIIADNGPGVSSELHARIFEPFFTTKEKGSGLGLWVSQMIVRRNGGSIRVRSATKPGRSGTAFLVFLPIGSS